MIPLLALALAASVSQSDSVSCDALIHQSKALLRPGISGTRARVIVDSLGYSPSAHQVVPADSIVPQASMGFMLNQRCTLSARRVADGLMLVLHFDASQRLKNVGVGPFFRGP